MNTQYCSMAESFRSAPETIALLISYTPIQNKKFKKKNIVNCKHDKGPKAGMRKESRRHTGFWTRFSLRPLPSPWGEVRVLSLAHSSSLTSVKAAFLKSPYTLSPPVTLAKGASRFWGAGSLCGVRGVFKKDGAGGGGWILILRILHFLKAQVSLA